LPYASRTIDGYRDFTNAEEEEKKGKLSSGRGQAERERERVKKNDKQEGKNTQRANTTNEEK
jgi:phage protein D